MRHFIRHQASGRVKILSWWKDERVSSCDHLPDEVRWRRTKCRI